MSTSPVSSITAGMVGETSWTVSKEHTVNRMGRPGADVLSTPSMIMLMEMAAIEAVDARLGAGFATVGFHVDVKHFGAAALGARVTARAEVTAVDGNKIAFTVAAFAGERKIGEGTHRRAAVATAP